MSHLITTDDQLALCHRLLKLVSDPLVRELMEMYARELQTRIDADPPREGLEPRLLSHAR